MTNLPPRFDTSTLAKALIGFDRMFADAERVFTNSIQSNYPPCNILKADDDNYIVEIAVTGFKKDEISIEVINQQLIVSAEATREENTEVEYIYHGLASRAFERKFNLTDHMQISEATLANGLLRVYIKRVIPEALRARKIPISTK